ncbi:autotransporter domain-containing protein [Bradyrhizobium mercantei]|uniref:autotransporter domain-containing protein n=1 Tax=Bradyrhizobium mercantei TaxID=1904807 RepID=UPI001FDA89D2|nr:autotransporter domain-containing protein [Bradyrhizobium mercantei]
MLPGSWTFTANSQSYTINGNPVGFSVSGPAGGLINQANNGQTITINANLTNGIGGPAMVQQLGNSTLVLAGTNAYSGGTLISAGIVQVTNADSVGTGTITLNGGTFQMQSPTVSSIAFSNGIAVNAAGGTVDANGAQVNLQGVIADGAGAGVLRLIDSSASGFSNVQLSGVNTYSGGTQVVDTTVIVTNSKSVGSGAVTLDNASFQADGLSNLTFGNNFKINNSAIGSAIDANGVTLTIAGNIADGNGPGKLTVLDNSGGLGRVVLTGTNTFTGGTSICDCATLQLGDASHTASIVGEVAVDGKLDIVNADTAGITKIVNDGFNGIATTTFYNSTTASTATIINQNFGLTEFRDSSTAGNATVSNTNGALTIFRDASSAGNATFSNSFGGTLVFGDALGPPGGSDTSTAGKAVIDNHDGGSTVFLGHTNAGQAKISNGISGGTLFFESSSAASATIVTAAFGQVAFFQNSTAANASFDNSGLLYFGSSGFSPLEAPTAASATIVNRAGGFLEFDAHATAGNATIDNKAGGQQAFMAFATAGGATITTEAGGAVGFYDNSTGGNAQFITNGTGLVDFSLSTGPNGDGRITAGSIAGSGFYYIGSGNTLVVGSNNLSTTLSGVLADYDPLNPFRICGCFGAGRTGPANLEKIGSGTLTLSGVNTYTGTTVVNGGILQVDGSIASSSSVTVNSGGALSGSGTVGTTTIASGGILLPGNGTSGTSLNVAGNLALQSGALYLVGLSSTASTSTKVTGTAALAGSVGASVAAGSTIAKQYTILSAAGGRSGAFAGLDSTGLPSGLVATLGYDANNAYLNFALDYGAASKLNVNQNIVATTLQNFFNANGGINVAFAGLTPNGLTQASGEGATGSQQTTFNAMNQFLGLLTDPFVAGRDGGFGGGAGAVPYAAESATLAYAARKTEPRDALAAIYAKAPPPQPNFDQRWSVWAAGYGGSQTTSGNAVLGSNNTSSSIYGTAVGADYRVSPNTIAGFALAGGGTSFSVNGLGWGRSDLFQAGAFVRHSVGAAYLSAALAYGWQDITTDRIVTAAGVDHLRANFNANAWSSRLEGGYRTATPWIGLTPYAAAQFTSFELPAYAESVVSGGGAFALNYAAKSVTDVRSELGLRSDKSFAVDSGIVTLRGRVAWAHDFNSNRTVGAVFQTLPGAAFVVNGAAQASDSALTTASLEMKWRSGWSAAATFEGEFSDVTQSYAGKGVMRYTW